MRLFVVCNQRTHLYMSTVLCFTVHFTAANLIILLLLGFYKRNDLFVCLLCVYSTYTHKFGDQGRCVCYMQSNSN